jgi:nitrile hydratase
MTTPRFKVGDTVKTRVDNPKGHTRLPRYVRGRTGTIESVRGVAPVPDDTVKNGAKGDDVPFYGVLFEMQELWGQDAEPGAELVIELWESYLQ